VSVTIINGSLQRDQLLAVAKVVNEYFETRFRIWDYRAVDMSGLSEEDIKYIAESVAEFKKVSLPGSHRESVLFYVMGDTSKHPLMRMYQSMSEINRSPTDMYTVRSIDDTLSKIESLKLDFQSFLALHTLRKPAAAKGIMTS